MIRKIILLFFSFTIFAQESPWKKLSIFKTSKEPSALNKDCVPHFALESLGDQNGPVLVNSQVLKTLVLNKYFTQNIGEKKLVLNDNDREYFFSMLSHLGTESEIINKFSKKFNETSPESTSSRINPMRSFPLITKKTAELQKKINHDLYKINHDWYIFIPSETFSHGININGLHKINYSNFNGQAKGKWQERDTNDILKRLLINGNNKWNIGLWGHGSSENGIICDHKVENFISLLSFLDKKVNTNTVTITSCHSGGKISDTINKALPDLKYTIVNHCGNAGLLEFNNLLAKSKFKDYFLSIESSKPNWHKALAHLNWEDTVNLSGMPKIRSPHDSNFRAIDLGSKVLEIGSISARLMKAENIELFSASKMLLLSTKKIESPININSDSNIASASQAETQHYLKDLTINFENKINNQDVYKTLVSIFNRQGIDSSREFYVENLTLNDRSGIPSSASKLIFFLNSKILLKPNQNGFIIKTPNDKYIASSWNYKELPPKDFAFPNISIESNKTPFGNLIESKVQKHFRKVKRTETPNDYALLKVLEERSSSSASERSGTPDISDSLKDIRRDSPTWQEFQGRYSSFRSYTNPFSDSQLLSKPFATSPSSGFKKFTSRS